MKVKFTIPNKVTKEQLIKEFEEKDADTIALIIMDTAKEAFDETNFYYYFYMLHIANLVNSIVREQIISIEFGKEIHQKIAEYFNNNFIIKK
ncbi:hypothetical protein [Clostridium intestinale]|uniref:Uncharacterized protein n=1 Tax=Clostridium intestinale TaxID=36845 RepID=A0A7D6ZEQ2_9CLOT|nr:hypothetical protein [Clostridium intestinale]QLY77819.1 hypothetical protein HZF06_11925 [Clostridium intestinale]